VSLQEKPCVRQNLAGMHWDPPFGFASKILDKACARDLFKSDKTKVLLFGGSAMDSALAPNYLTTIDHYRRSRAINKSVLMLPALRRIRDREQANPDIELK
jgi:hypothetical protein